MTSMTGSCLCGSVRYEVSGEPLFARFCCCRDCQRQSGSGHAAGWGFPATGFRLISGEPKRYAKTGDSGNTITRCFCPDCGSTAFLLVSARPHLLTVRVGTLDDPSGFRPESAIFVRSGQPWDHIDPALPRYPTYPPGYAEDSSLGASAGTKR